MLADFELSPAETVVLENGLRLLDRADAAAAELARDGLTTVDRYGATRAHPLIDVELRGRREFNAALRQLGVRLVEEGSSGSRPWRTGPRPYTAERRN